MLAGADLLLYPIHKGTNKLFLDLEKFPQLKSLLSLVDTPRFGLKLPFISSQSPLCHTFSFPHNLDFAEKLGAA